MQNVLTDVCCDHFSCGRLPLKADGRKLALVRRNSLFSTLNMSNVIVAMSLWLFVSWTLALVV